jgi:hypothetical protein
VLRPAHLAYYKSSAEYQLLRLLELSDVHSCTQVALKKHENTFGLVSPVRTFYLQAKTSGEVQEWVRAIEEARQTLMATSTQNSVSSPIPIRTPTRRSSSRIPPPITPSPPSQIHHIQSITSSDSEDASPSGERTYSSSSQDPPIVPPSPTRAQGITVKDSAKIILSGYLMKCGSKRRNWRKRWFVLTGEKLVYSGSHMVGFAFNVRCARYLILSDDPRTQRPIVNSRSGKFWMPWSMTYPQTDNIQPSFHRPRPRPPSARQAGIAMNCPVLIPSKSSPRNEHCFCARQLKRMKLNGSVPFVRLSRGVLVLAQCLVNFHRSLLLPRRALTPISLPPVPQSAGILESRAKSDDRASLAPADYQLAL